MRNLLKRHAPRDASKPTLRARLAGAKGKLVAVKEKCGRTLRVHRTLMAPVPVAEPVERIALINYATWLYYERRSVCRELYPENGARAAAFVHANVAADEFHFPSSGKALAAAASIRAVATLDRLGIDWRRDRDDSDWAEPASGEPAAPLPHGWPVVDAELIEALGDLRRLDLAIDALGTYGPGDDRELSDLPAWDDLDAYRDLALDRLAKKRAESLTGLQAKAQALLTRSVAEQGPYTETGVIPWRVIAESLARDLVGAHPSALDRRRPDPMPAVIQEARRLTREHGRLHDAASRLPGTDPAWGLANEAHAAMWDYLDTVLSKTVPQTAAGCTTLARFALAFTKEQGAPVVQGDDANLAVLDLIARSPLRA